MKLFWQVLKFSIVKLWKIRATWFLITGRNYDMIRTLKFSRFGFTFHLLEFLDFPFLSKEKSKFLLAKNLIFALKIVHHCAGKSKSKIDSHWRFEFWKICKFRETLKNLWYLVSCSMKSPRRVSILEYYPGFTPLLA